jgi:hypothetical protein
MSPLLTEGDFLQSQSYQTKARQSRRYAMLSAASTDNGHCQMRGFVTALDHHSGE